MPATILSHQALVLPLKLRWPHAFSGLALCIGSAAPDLEFILRATDDWTFSHTFAAQFYFTVPLTLALVWVATSLVLPTVLPFVREHTALRLHDLAALDAPRGWRGWARVAMSALLGGLSHWVLDGLTHGNHSGWLVPVLPWLRTMVPHPGGAVPLHDALQLWLTVLGAAASAMMWRHVARRRLLWRWRNVAPRDPRTRARHEGERLVLGALVAAAIGAAVGLWLRAADSPKALAAGVAFGAIDAVALLILAFACWLRRRRGRVDRNSRRPPFASAAGRGYRDIAYTR